MGSHVHEDDVYFAYGSIFSDKSRVVIFTRNKQVETLDAIISVTTRLHQTLLNDRLNPLCSNKLFSDKFVSLVISIIDPLAVRD